MDECRLPPDSCYLAGVTTVNVIVAHETEMRTWLDRGWCGTVPRLFPMFNRADMIWSVHCLPHWSSQHVIVSRFFAFSLSLSLCLSVSLSSVFESRDRSVVGTSENTTVRPCMALIILKPSDGPIRKSSRKDMPLADRLPFVKEACPIVMVVGWFPIMESKRTATDIAGEFKVIYPAPGAAHCA
ncbi:hypothetical protein LY76DRAFT_182356 [Colletotrichum caudatum]|nr:hypothetical protein LY76DRAFT_182356 [Colletotrichum caudatum]